MDTKTRPKAPAKTYRGGQFAVQKMSISRACETKLGCVLSFLENAIKEAITQIYVSKGKRTNMLQKRQTVFQSPMWSESKEKTPNSQRQNTNNDIRAKYSSVKDQVFAIIIWLNCHFSWTNHNGECRNTLNNC